MRVPASLIAIPLLAGCCTGIALAGHSDPGLSLRLACAAALTLVAAVGFFADDCDCAVALATVIGCALSGLSAGLSAGALAYRPDLLAWCDALDQGNRDAPALLEGQLREDAALYPAGVSLLLDTQGIVESRTGTRRPTDGGVRLTVAGFAAASLTDRWRAGRTIRAPVLLRKPTTYGDPGLPDDVRGLARRGVALLGTVKSGSLIEVIDRGDVLSEAAADARAWARRQLGHYVGGWDPRSGAIAIAILIGDRSGLSDVDERRLQDAGTYHVIAISGGNIAILAAILLGVLRCLNLPPGSSAGITIAVLLFYGQIASGGASVSRAVTAACVYLGGRMIDQRGPPLNALAVAAFIGLAVSPLAAFDGGFILSFGATAGILLGVPRLAGALARGPLAPRREKGSRPSVLRRAASGAIRAVGSLLTATICAEIALTPVSALLFSRITIAGLALNFIAIPLMTVAQAAAMCTLAATAGSERAAYACGYVTHIASSYLVRSAALVEYMPWASQLVVAPPWWLIAGYYAFCFCLLTRRYWRFGLLGVAGAMVLMVAPTSFALPLPRPRPGILRVVFLDVGQGDATLVQFPDARTILVDAGGVPGSGFDIGERVISPALHALGVRSIDTLVVTHGDPDHIGGAPAVLRRFAPRQVWEGVPVPPHPALRDLESSALAAGASWRTVQSHDHELDSGVQVRVLHPPLPDWERQRVRNEDSVVLELRLGDVSIVLPGDIGREAEQLLVPRLATGPITIVKAPHHGSATSSTQPFVSTLHPAAVIFSVGRGNHFGHPAPLVVARYAAAHSMVFRTDEDGAIVLDTDGRSVEITTWVSGKRVRLR